ncbi:efflux RND transporter periplasmic adaptor subunit [Phormidium tenue]|jgi:HlyD family secretion protein|uniref:Efflux RND transporter periplasmic adaptor subunit n=1 Tax=Phormidium tenue FACHB-1050 TaxID=2692857 RepID=A0ABR8CD43_9CYAN|nr:efflux RND transporter periplasmic adaptor subunit [Phormidium tenue]MBD2318246.1 efflux RND transporter periplasmic adaptor subunit [Phormidium tenue FACHB-1050]
MQSLMTIKISKFNFWKLGISAIGLVGTIAIAYIIFRPQPTPEINIETDTVLVKSQDLQLQIKVNGLVQSIRKINISPSTQGRIMELFVREGDRIQAGQAIARMDDEQLQAQVSQYEAILDRSQAQLAERLAGSRQEEVAKAEADVIRSEARVQEARSRLQLAKEKLNRRQILQKEGAITREALNESQVDVRNAEDNLTQTQASLAISQQDLARQRSGFRAEEIAQTRAQVAEANAQLQSFQIQLNNTLVRAPFGGIITRRFTDVGDFVAPTTSASSSDGATSASIAELSSGLEVEAKVPEANIAGIKQGQSVEVRSDSYPDQVFKGQVQSIAPRAVKENSITSFRVKVKLETGLEQLKAGMNVKLAFIAEPIQNALVVPLSAVVTQKDGQRGIWLLDANREIRFQLIRLGSENGSQAQILEGLKAGDRILISPPANQIIPGVDNTQGTGM